MEDFITELVNTVAGRFAADLAGNEGMIGLGLPVAVANPPIWLDSEMIDRRLLFRFDVDMNPGFCIISK